MADRPLALEDAPQVQRLFPVWEVVQYLNDQVPWPFADDGVLSHYRDVALPAIARGEAWQWTLRLHSEHGEIIGSASLHLGENNRGFWLGVPWQGRGLMTEASDAITDFWFDTLGLSVLRVPKAIANTASRRISERCGMRVIGEETRHFVAGPLPAEIWEITAEEWHAYRCRQEGAPVTVTESGH